MSHSATPETPLPVSSIDLTTDDTVAAINDPEENRLRELTAEHPTDILRYLRLIEYLESRDQVEKSRAVYDTLHAKFPFYSALWSLQIQTELINNEFSRVERLLAQCLSGDYQNNDPTLWSTYLDYVRRKNNLITGGQEARSIVIKAFQLVISKCAIFEPRSGQYWNDYLQFLEQWNPVNKWEEQQKIDMIRDLYKQMLKIPFDNLEKMWNRYTQWEQDVNSLTARKFIGELSAEYMKARSLYQEWCNVTKGLRRTLLMSLKSASKHSVPHPDRLDVEQLYIWLDWLRWELENKLELDEGALHQRITYVYKQAIQFMMYAPEIWYNYAMFLEDPMDRQLILSTSVRANPCSPSLTFKLAESYELDNKVESVQKVFEECASSIHKEYERHLKNANNENEDPDVYSIRRKLTFVYCVYMNTMKRLSGLTAARTIFGKCRKLKRHLTHDVYIENAYLEFRNQNDYKTACRVLELGLKYFSGDGDYILKYMDFLILIDRDSQLKTLFETTIDKIGDTNHLKSLFKKMLSYESKYGNLNNVSSLEKRYLEKFPKDNLIELLTDRYQIQNTNLIKKLEFTYMNNEPETSNTCNDGNTPKKRSNGDPGNISKRQKFSPTLPPEIHDLLCVLPKRQYFQSAILDPANLINYLTYQIDIPKEKEDS